MEQDEGYEAHLVEQQRLLAQLRAGGKPASTPHAGAGVQEAVASSGDGAVRVVVQSRRVTTLNLGAGVTRRSRSAVSAVLRETINRALAQSLADSPRAGDPGPNLAAIGEELSEFAQDSGRALRQIQGAVEQSMTKLSDKVRIRGDASPQHVDFLFDDALEILRAMQAALNDGASTPIAGEGRDESNEVAATVSHGELTRLMVTGLALQMPPDELGHAVQDAVNEALTEWEQHNAEAASPADPEELQRLAERASAIRRQSMQHLRTYTESMTSIMRNVD